MGLLVANHCSSPRQWQQLEIDLLKQLATQVAIAIQQSTLSRHKPNSTNASRRNRKYANKLPCSMLQQTFSFKIWKTKFYSGTRCGATVRLEGKRKERCQRAFVSGHFTETRSCQIPSPLKVSGRGVTSSHEIRQRIVESRWTLVREQEEKPKSILIVNTDITEKNNSKPSSARPATGEPWHPASGII